MLGAIQPAYGQASYWEPTEGPLGGDIPLLAYDAENGVMLASNGVALYRRSVDEHAWTPIDTAPRPITALAVLSSGTYALASATMDRDAQGRSVTWGTVWLSTDQGIHWASTELNELEGPFWLIDVSPDGIVFASNASGLYRSFDQGQNWTRVSSGTNHLAFGPNGSMFAITAVRFAVYLSEDYGATWIKQQGVSTDTEISATVVNAQGNPIVAYLNWGLPTLLHSFDNGKNWDLLSEDLDRIYINHLTRDESGRLYAATNTHGLFRSIDHGVTWERMPLGVQCVHRLLIQPNGLLLAGTPQGVFHSEDGGQSWTWLHENMRGTRILALHAWQDKVLAATANQGLFQTQNSSTWHPLFLPPPPDSNSSEPTDELLADASRFYYRLSIPIHTFLDTDGVLLAGGLYGFYRSSDNGATWKSISLNGAEPPLHSRYLDLSDLARHPDGTVYVSLRRIGIYYSIDLGDTWLPTKLRYQGHDVGAGALAFNDDGRGVAIDGARVFSLRKDDKLWVPTHTSSNIEGIGHTITPHPEAGFLIGTYTNYYGRAGLYQSNHPSQPYTRIAFADTSVFDLLYDADNTLFAATEAGVFQSFDDGQSWTSITKGLPNTAIRTLAYDAAGFLYAGTWGEGVFRSRQPLAATRTAVTPLFEQPDVSITSYPNPFRDRVTFRYTLSRPGPVRLLIYDLLGRPVAQPLDATQTAGTHEISFEATGLPSGLYVYFLQTTDQKQRGAMLLTR